MRYKRNESFRYIFPKQLPATFKIHNIDGRNVTTEEGNMEIFNISSKGMRISSTLHIPNTERKDVQLTIAFQLNEKQFDLTGKIIWQKKLFDKYDYGITLIVDEEMKDELIKQIKAFSVKVAEGKTM